MLQAVRIDNFCIENPENIKINLSPKNKYYQILH